MLHAMKQKRKENDETRCCYDENGAIKLLSQHLIYSDGLNGEKWNKQPKV